MLECGAMLVSLLLLAYLWALWRARLDAIRRDRRLDAIRRDRRLVELIELNEEAIKKHAPELDEETVAEEAARAALEQYHDELEGELSASEDERTVYLAPREEFDGALLRIEEGVAIYSAERVIEIYMERDGMTEDDARDFFSYNCEGAYVGPFTPRYEWQEFDE